jgi:hypothetical protein
VVLYDVTFGLGLIRRSNESMDINSLEVSIHPAEIQILWDVTMCDVNQLVNCDSIIAWRTGGVFIGACCETLYVDGS